MLSKSKPRFITLFWTGSMILSACSTGATPGAPPSPTSPTQPPPTVESASSTESDLCLQGDWVMPTGDLDLMIATLVPIPGVRVPSGELLILFDGSTYRYLSYGFILHTDIDTGEYMEATLSFENSGSFSTSDGFILFNSITSESEVSSWTRYKNGETYIVPGTGPQIAFSMSGENPYRCTAERLEIDTFHPTLGTMTLFFTPSS